MKFKENEEYQYRATRRIGRYTSIRLKKNEEIHNEFQKVIDIHYAAQKDEKVHYTVQKE